MTNGLSEAERFLIDAVRRGDEQAWPQLVARYQGRLLAFARQRLRRDADAEDFVQETFIGLLRSIGQFRGQSSLETYLFTILRRRIIDAHRGKKAGLCLLGDQQREACDESDPAAHLASPEPSASWYVRRREDHDAQRLQLAEAIKQLVGGYKDSLNFRELEVIELLFYAQLGNSEVAAAVGVSAAHVTSIKHRSLSRIRKHLLDHATSAPHQQADPPDVLLTQVWEDHRPSCPKRSTIGAFHLGTLDPAWRDYVDFHLHKLGCRFCLANLQDVQASDETIDQQRLRQRILQSTVGFLKQN